MANDFDVRVEQGITILDRVTAPVTYADGISQLMLGFPMSKMVLHVVIEPATEQTGEVRKVVQTLNIPTISAVQLASLIIGFCIGNREQILPSMDAESRARFLEILNNLPKAPAEI